MRSITHAHDITHAAAATLPCQVRSRRRTGLIGCIYQVLLTTERVIPGLVKSMLTLLRPEFCQDNEPDGDAYQSGGRGMVLLLLRLSEDSSTVTTTTTMVRAGWATDLRSHLCHFCHFPGPESAAWVVTPSVHDGAPAPGEAALTA